MQKAKHTDRTNLENLLNSFNKMNKNSSIHVQNKTTRNRKEIGSPNYITKTIKVYCAIF
ncbi:conserved hypothetical protein (plasmid) [Borreliella burgdorferi WI91-23]|nr:conserved hypothetical protein [Borreliella burgdorferi WI91-23]